MAGCAVESEAPARAEGGGLEVTQGGICLDRDRRIGFEVRTHGPQHGVADQPVELDWPVEIVDRVPDQIASWARGDGNDGAPIIVPGTRAGYCGWVERDLSGAGITVCKLDVEVVL